MECFKLWLEPCLVWILIFCVCIAKGQQTWDCPRGWLSYQDSCYKFVLRPKLTVQEAQLACYRLQGHLVNVDVDTENTFISGWILHHDGEKLPWITGGERRGDKMYWNSNGREITRTYFPNDIVKKQKTKDAHSLEYKQIVYIFGANNNTYNWGWERLMKPMSYICEIEKEELWRLYQQDRDFSFGTGISNPIRWPIAPNITDQTGDIVFFRRDNGIVTPFILNCFATGNPAPSYIWYRKYDGSPATIVQSSSRYSITNGRIHFTKPNINTDAATYYCQASNSHGTVLSNPIHVSYGKLDEFSPVDSSPYSSRQYMGIEIDCQAPNYKPAATFNWYKGSALQSIRPALNPQMFLSMNGHLYISEVTPSEVGDYFCSVNLAARNGETLASEQTVSRTSLPVSLTVQGENANTYGPDIQDKFPQVFPRIPLVGQRMVIECLAYGRLPLRYNWVREDAPMNPKAYMVDRNRKLVIEKTSLSDTGAYTCVVNGVKSTGNRTRYVNMLAIPSFPVPLKNQFADKDSKFTWSCFAQGVPRPVYRWYKDGRKLEARDSGLGISVEGRHLLFDSISDKHNGAYQCEAENSLGLTRSGAQLIAVSLKPSFERSPVVSLLHVTSGGSITIQCQPEAAPRATIAWYREGGRALGGNSRILPTGALELSQISPSDQGVYTCEATNTLGSSTSSVTLTITEKTVLINKPESEPVNVNESISLKCKAAYDENVNDVIYAWKFYDHFIDFDVDVAYSMPYALQNTGDLYLMSAQYEHEGWYTCVASTVTDAVEAKAYITVKGPPREPIGVHKYKSSRTGSTELELWWTTGKSYGHPATVYTVEVKSEQDDLGWIPILEDLPDETIKVDPEAFPDWRGVIISKGLSPGSFYQFRVKAGNPVVGWSPPSEPSSVYHMDDAGPVFAPDVIGGGGGSERELNIKWEPLPRSKWGSDHIRYIVYFRRKAGNRIDGKWRRSKQLVETEFHSVVSADLFYTIYEVMIQAVNDYGSGPNSTIAEVLSAEKMPKFVPVFSSADAINSTAGTVEWEPVPNTRDVVLGSIFGFQVNYWQEDTKCIGTNERFARFTRVYGEATSVTLLGMEPGGDYCVNIQLLNHAGMSPKTENYYLGMNDPAPGRWPEYVYVSSHGPESVLLHWRGLVNQFGESPLVGYKAWYWRLQEDIRSAKSVDFGRSFSGIIRGIEKNEIYRLRMMGYNIGGDGKKAPDVMFTLGGLVSYNPQTTDVMNKSHRPYSSTLTLTSMLVLYIIVLLSTSH